jgi:hypothetical protein
MEKQTHKERLSPNEAWLPASGDSRESQGKDEPRVSKTYYFTACSELPALSAERLLLSIAVTPA